MKILIVAIVVVLLSSAVHADPKYLIDREIENISFATCLNTAFYNSDALRTIAKNTCDSFKKTEDILKQMRDEASSADDPIFILKIQQMDIDRIEKTIQNMEERIDRLMDQVHKLNGQIIELKSEKTLKRK